MAGASQARNQGMGKGCHSCNGRAEVKGSCRVGAQADLGG